MILTSSTVLSVLPSPTKKNIQKNIREEGITTEINIKQGNFQYSVVHIQVHLQPKKN